MLGVILIDDNNTIIEGLMKLIKWEENDLYVKGTFRNGLDALRYIENNRDVDIIFTDMKMPVMDGLEFIKGFIKTGIEAEIVCLSSYNEFALVREAFVLGVEDYILKSEIEPDKVIELCSKIRAKLMQTKYVYHSDVDHRIIQNVLSMVEAGLSKELNLKDIAPEFGISSGYLGQLFTKQLGMSFNDYLNQKRVEKATQMLSSGKYKIYEISSVCGYNSVEHFSRIFKKVTGKPPKQW